MAGQSKNNPDNRNSSGGSKHVLSNDCEACKDQCEKGRRYLKIFEKRKWGYGVVCIKR